MVALVALVAVGGATRVMERLHALPKTYVAEIGWGVETDTGDGGGIVVRRAPPPAPDVVRATLGAFLGWRDQVPPATSAPRWPRCSAPPGPTTRRRSPP